MRGVFLILCLGAAIGAEKCQGLDQDKLLHASLSANIAGMTYVALGKSEIDPAGKLILSLGAAMVVGIAKELADASHRSTRIDGADLLADGIGAGLGAGFCFAFDF